MATATGAGVVAVGTAGSGAAEGAGDPVPRALKYIRTNGLPPTTPIATPRSAVNQDGRSFFVGCLTYRAGLVFCMVVLYTASALTNRPEARTASASAY